MTLNTVRTADDKDGVVQYLKGSFHLRRKVHVSRRVQKRNGKTRQRKSGLLGEDGNASGAFHRIRIQKGIFGIDTTQRADGAGGIQQCFR